MTGPRLERSLRFAALGVAVLAIVGGLAGCGGEDSTGSSASRAAIQAWGLGAEGRRDVPVEEAAHGCNTVVMFVIDRVTRAELGFVPTLDAPGPGATPRLDAVAAGAEIALDAITPSTGGNAALASLFTGRLPVEHGVGTLRDLGRAALRPDVPTIAEVLRTDDWTTIASMSSPRHARGFSGLARGFDEYAAPRLGERERGADGVVNGARFALTSALRQGEKVFAVYGFGGHGDRSSAGGLAPAAVAPFVARHLAPLRKRSAQVDAALLRMETEPGEALADLDELLGRARGSELSNALSAGRREAGLAAIDSAIGTVLDQLEQSGRAEHAMVAVVGLRGDLPRDARTETGPRLVPSVIEVPLALRYPCGAAADLPTSPLSLTEVPQRIAATFGLDLGLGEPAGAGVALTCDPRFSVAAVLTPGWHYEQYVDGEVVAFDRTGSQAPGDTPDPAGLLGTGGLLGSGALRALPRTELRLSTVDRAGDMELSWHVAEGRAFAPTSHGEPLDSEPRAPSARGKRRISGATRALELPLSSRGSAVRIGVVVPAADSAGIERIAIGDTLASELPLLLCPSPDGPTVTEGETLPVTLTRTNGLWWTLAVAGEGDTELLLTVWPPRDPTEELEVSAGGAVVAHDVPGRRDMVRLLGTAPFDLRVKKVGKEDFALTCSIDGRFVQPHEIAFNGLRYGDLSSAEFALFDWQPSCSAALPSVDAALYLRPESMPLPPAGALLSIRRDAPGGAPASNAAPDFDGLEFLRLLPPGE